jgi:hypothetical protein
MSRIKHKLSLAVALAKLLVLPELNHSFIPSVALLCGIGIKVIQKGHKLWLFVSKASCSFIDNGWTSDEHW